MPRALEGDYLEPRTEVERNGFSGTFLFATTNPLLSLCYAMRNGTKLYSNTMDDGSVYVVVPLKTIETNDVKATTYSMHGDTFTHFRDNQYVTEYEIHRSELREEWVVNNLDCLMQRGLQIFYVAPGEDDIPYEIYSDPQIKIDLLTKEKLASGELCSLNEERGFAPHPFFAINGLKGDGAPRHAGCNRSGGGTLVHRTPPLSSGPSHRSPPSRTV